MSDVVVIRPGCTDFDAQHRIQGTLDLPLNERGEQQVAELVEQLRPLPIEALYTGDCEPARSTAEAIGRELGVEVREVEGLRNLDQGLWQGLPVEDIRRKFPKVYRQWQDEPERICPPEGETVPAAVERIRKALHRPLKKRGMIGVVASEPLATLICCMIRGCRPTMPNPPTDPAGRPAPVSVLTMGTDGSVEDSIIEAAVEPVIETNGRPPGHATNGQHPTTPGTPS
jgi:phosphoserine phosphatase